MSTFSLRRAAWSPYVAGAIIGLLQIPASPGSKMNWASALTA